MKQFITILIIALTAGSFSACKDNNEPANQLLEEIQADFDNGRYEKALKGIDSLRKTYPKAIEARKAALPLHQEASLRLTQQNLAVVDSTLQAVENEYAALAAQVKAHGEAGTLTAEEQHKLNMLRAKRDSLKSAFDVACSKIKYIHKRQKQLEL